MSEQRLKVGIIGGSLRNRWASSTHIPALLQSQHHQITAVATTKLTSAQEAAQAIGAVEAYNDYSKMLESDQVDMVIVSVKAPYHKQIVLDTIQAQKHVYCEWPLAANLEEVNSIMEEIRHSPIRHAIGLQSRQSEEVQLVKQMIDNQEFGKILSVHMKVSTQAKGNWVDQGSSYILDSKNGATLLSINGGHALDIVTFIFGQFTEVQASQHTHYTEAHIIESDAKIEKNTADQYLIQGKLNANIPIAVHLQGGAYPQFLLEIQGEHGVIRLGQNQSIGHPQYGRLHVSVAKYNSSQSIATSQPDDFIVVKEDQEKSPFTNVFRAHQSFAKDILTGTAGTPDFYSALALHRLIDAIEISARTGEKVRMTGGSELQYN
ncbi:Gfo/Idh/MocA family protein [Paenibacillus sp. J22TS3]|uniref:Gfo/Idh/MocA family protein n=1 Tax=Paenibacillus sp. J22TS3 TaxID=2807192 RepID=UPI001B2F593B|nr:Gfo/Idh/MocA family oxidoreductase [Paenibacillus sp. J22TS3]GIP24370.1 oxidoreductase [Paenibacillus sp. J22TS3]